MQVVPRLHHERAGYSQVPVSRIPDRIRPNLQRVPRERSSCQEGRVFRLRHRQGLAINVCQAAQQRNSVAYALPGEFVFVC